MSIGILDPEAQATIAAINGAGFAANEGEAQEVEGLRLAEPSLLTALRRKASELDQPGLLRMQRQRKLSQPLAHLVQEALGVVLVLHPEMKSSA
jgi:hypothetical protein